MRVAVARNEPVLPSPPVFVFPGESGGERARSPTIWQDRS
jgi:hypothetical protein